MKDKLSTTNLRQEMELPLDPDYDRVIRHNTPRILPESHSFEEFCRRQRVRLNDKWDRAVERIRNEQPIIEQFESRK
jgi:hypothetical protein